VNWKDAVKKSEGGDSDEDYCEDDDLDISDEPLEGRAIKIAAVATSVEDITAIIEILAPLDSVTIATEILGIAQQNLKSHLSVAIPLKDIVSDYRKAARKYAKALAEKKTRGGGEDDIDGASEMEEPQYDTPLPTIADIRAAVIAAGLKEHVADEIEAVIQTAICAAFEYIKNPPWLILQGAPACGKDFLCDFFLGNLRISKETMKMSPNAFNPSRPNADSEANGIIASVKNRMWVISELGILFRNEDDATNFMFQIMGMYGKDHGVNDDPAGERQIPTYFTTCFGGTHAMVDQLMGMISSFGPRYMVLNIPSDREWIHPLNIDDLKKIREMVARIILDRKGKKLPPVTLPASKTAFNFAKKFTIMRSTIRTGDIDEDVEDTKRVQFQLETCAQLRALLYGRDVMVEDVLWWIHLVCPTVGYVKAWRAIADGWQPPDGTDRHSGQIRALYSHAKELGIATDQKDKLDTGDVTWGITESWSGFVGDVIYPNREVPFSGFEIEEDDSLIMEVIKNK